ncbi:MAG: hypothetical protein WCO42_10625 [bacterium]
MKEYTNIPLDDDENHIWDGWTYNAGNAGDDADSEPTGKNHPGDNISRYEEYRGFLCSEVRWRTNPTKKTVFICNQDSIDSALVLYGPENKLGYEVKIITTNEMTDGQVINANYATAHLKDMYSILLQKSDLSSVGITAGHIDTKAICKVDFSKPEYWVGDDMVRLLAYEKLIVAHELGHALYLDPPGVPVNDGHMSPKICIMDQFINPYPSWTPPTDFCSIAGSDDFICKQKHSVKGP